MFDVRPLPGADHPNTVEIRMTSPHGRELLALAKSIGGGAVVFTRLADWPVCLTGDAYDGAQSQPFMDAARPVYELYGRTNNLALFNHRQGHRVPLEAAERMCGWLETHLRRND